MPPAHQTKSTALNMPFKILPYFYLLPLTTNNPCLGHTEFLNISRVQPCSFTTSVTIQVAGLGLVFVVVLCKIVLWLCKRNPCLGPYALGGLALTLSSGHPSPTGRQSMGPRLYACTGAALPLLDHTPSDQGSSVARPKDPSLPLGPVWVSSYMQPSELSPNHAADHS